MTIRFWLSRLREEGGSSIVELLLALGLIALVVAVGVQGFAYLQARSVATAAAQDGARAAVAGGTAAGLARSREVLNAGGGAAAALKASLSEDPAGVTVTVAGSAASVFPLSLLVPPIRTSATLPLEQYPTNEQAAAP